ncbi:MAG TPA: GNAT family N-acetyltransferase [Gaiellaceae bacterium]|nr:GNAT family N-acetyltransferase [Gaiellaceae bacterium]
MIRIATSADDLRLARELCDEFNAEVPDKPWRVDDTAESLDHTDLVLLADDVGVAVATSQGPRMWFLDVVYVRPPARGQGIGVELIREIARHAQEAGAEMVELDVLETNSGARRLYDRLGFHTVERSLAAPAAALAASAPGGGPTFGFVHVQTDEIDVVSRNVAKVLPRLGRAGPSEVTGPENGWVRVRSETTDTDPAKLQALAKELSYTSGGVTLALGVEDGAIVRYNLFDRGSSVDEYASVPEYRGALPPGDVIALGANPTVVARLTGADPHRVREIARTAESPADLPPAQELYEEIATLMGVKA